MDDKNYLMPKAPADAEEISRFTDSYASFNRIINSLQRKYIELKDEFSLQNRELAESNKKLVELTHNNITATEFLNGILTSITAGVIAVDQNGRVTHFNPSASLIYGIRDTDALGKQYRDIIPPGEPTHANALRAVESGRETEAVEKVVETPLGSRLNLSVSTAIIRDNDGRSVGAVEVFHDLTKIRKMEREIARLNTLAALGEMAATIAHEVRNPLAGIGGFAALLERDLTEDDPKKKLVRKIITGVNNLNGTVETLLNYTRYEEIHRTEVDFVDFIESTIDQFRNDNFGRIEKVAFNRLVVKEANPLLMKIDRMLFRQVLCNVFANSIEAIRGEGTISYQVRRLGKREALARYADRMLLGAEETVVETILSDDGPGIESEHMERIFAPFYTTKPDGNGLGLAVAWKIVKAHSGEIFAENIKDGQGVAFYILLPAPAADNNGE